VTNHLVRDLRCGVSPAHIEIDAAPLCVTVGTFDTMERGLAGPRQAMPEFLPEVVPAVEIGGGSVARFGGAG